MAHVADDADDLERKVPADIDQQTFAKGVFVREEPPSQFFADDDDLTGRSYLLLGELTAPKQGDFHRAKIVLIDAAVIGSYHISVIPGSALHVETIIICLPAHR